MRYTDTDKENSWFKELYFKNTIVRELANCVLPLVDRSVKSYYTILQPFLMIPLFRYAIYKLKLDLGKNCLIKYPFYFNNGQNIIIGDNVGIGDGCYIVTKNEEVFICSDTLLSPNVHISTIEHGSTKEEEVVICSNCWIGRNVVISPGVVINKGCVIGANSFVKKGTRTGVDELWAGCPAKKIKNL